MKFLSIIFFLTICTSSSAAEVMKANEKLTQDSLVFTLEEGHKMQEYISELEAQVNKQNELIVQYKELDNIQTFQIQGLNSYLENKDAQIAKYIELKTLDENRIETLTKQSKSRKLENVGSFVGGVLVTVGLILTADKIDDAIEDQAPGL